MNGTIVQLVALACRGNARLRGIEIGRPLLESSPGAFCESVRFVDARDWTDESEEERPIADSAEEWIEGQAADGALGLRILFQFPPQGEAMSRMTAGFAGGGGDWRLCVRRAEAIELWASRWEVGESDAADQRIWRVTYGLVFSQPRSLPAAASAEPLRAPFRETFAAIEAFATKHQATGYAESFARAIESLDRRRPREGFDRELVPAGLLSEEALSLLDAAQSAWVFGGMGSWNDIVFEGEDGEEYERLSAALYAQVIEVICAAANESDRGA